MGASKSGKKKLNREQLIDLFEKMPISAIFIEQEQIVFNNATERLIGYRKDEITSVDDWFRKLYGAEHKKVRQLYEADREAGFPAPREVTLTRKDGGVRVVEFSGAGTDIVVSILNDVTDRNLAEERLRASEQRFRAIADYTYDWENWFGPDGKLIWVNPAVEMFTGLTIDECMLLPNFPLPIVHEEDREEIAQRFTSAVNGSSDNDVEFRILCKDGSTKWVAVSWQPIYNSDGISLGHRSSIRDITQRKHSEEALRMTREWLVMAQRAANAGSWSWDFSTGKLTWSEDFFTLFDLAPTSEPSFDTWLAKLHPDDRKPALEKIEQSVKDRTFLDNEYRIIRSDGQERWICSLGTTFCDEAGQPLSMCGLCIDITERKRMEEELRLAHEELEKRVIERTEQLEKTADALRTSEERYALAVQGSNDGIWDLNLATGEAYHSPRWKGILGFEENEIADNFKEWESRIHPDDYQRVMENYKAYLEGRIPTLEIEHRLRHKDESYRWVVSRGACLRDSHGMPYRVAGSLSDVTETKRAEEALKQSERHFRQAVEYSPVAMAKTCGTEENILLVNRKFTELFGYTLEDIPDLGHWWPLAYPDEKYREEVKAEWTSKVEQAIKNRCPFEPIEAMVTCKDGSIRHIEFNFSCVGERNLVTFIDLTEIKKAEEVIRASEKKYRTLFEKSKDAIFIWDNKRRVIDVNHACIELFGYTKEEILVDLERLYCHQEEGKHFWQRLQKFGFISDYEVEMVKKDGERITVHLSMSVIKDDAGQISGYQGIIRDMTERKRLERQLLQSQKMESVGILAGGIAHDFNNLLTAISGYGQILLETLPEDDELSQESIGIVLKAADRAAELTRGLLAFSRKQLISPKPVHIDTLISDTGKLIKRIIGEDIEFSTNFSGKNLLLKADPGQVEQVLMNLATNARDAMPNGGRLSITTREVIVKDGSETLYDLPSPGKYAVISVADTGTGIDKMTLERIYDPFYTTKEVGKGTGLGLAIVLGIIKQHNGSVIANSEPGKGTTFDIYLPLVKGHAVKEDAKIPARHAGGLETILVVEDDETVRMFMEKILERAGYKVIIAQNGEEAVVRFKAHDEISLVLSDLVMPKMNGREMQDEIRKIKPGIKVIFISGYSADVMQKKGMLEKGTEFITKPYKKNDLLQKIREILDKD